MNTNATRITLRHRIWHALYVAWYDHHCAGHGIRARFWGALADAVVPVLPSAAVHNTEQEQSNG